MSEKHRKYRLLSSFLIVLTTTLIVAQVIFVVFNLQKGYDSKENTEITITEMQSEAILPVVIFPFYKAVFSLLFCVLLLLPVYLETIKRHKVYFSLFNIRILGSICMNGP